MDQIALYDIPIDTLTPSPFQSRKYFSEQTLQDLAKSIDRDGLIEPVVVRCVAGCYELIAGERRCRAVVLSGKTTILARIVEATDLQARRMCAAENMQRQDLSAVETVEGIVELIDSEMVDDSDYLAAGSTSKERVKWLLMKLDSDRRNGTDFTHKFMGKTDIIFGNLPKPVEWRSFYENDLRLIIELDKDEDLKKLAIEESHLKRWDAYKVTSSLPNGVFAYGTLGLLVPLWFIRQADAVCYYVFNVPPKEAA